MKKFILICNLFLFYFFLGHAQDSLRIITKVTQQIVCPDGHNGIARVFTADGYGSYSYNWSNGDTTEIADSLSYGWYQVTVTDTIPTVRVDSVFIFADSIHIEFILLKDTLCGPLDSSGSIQARVYGDGPFIYTWNNGDKGYLIQQVPAGKYILTVSDLNGCIGKDSVNIQSVPVRVANATITNATALGVNNGIYTINTNGGVNPASFYTEKITGWYENVLISFITVTRNSLPPGIYRTIVSDKICSVTFQDTINETNPFRLLSTIDTTACRGLETNSSFEPINGVRPIICVSSNGDTINWLVGDILPDGSSITQYNVNFFASDSNWVKMTDALGRIFTRKVVVTEPDDYLSFYREEYNDVTCHGGNNGQASVEVRGSYNQYIYNLSNGETTNSVIDLRAGTYTWTVSDTNNCIIYKTFTIHEPDPMQVFVDSIVPSCRDSLNDGELQIVDWINIDSPVITWRNAAGDSIGTGRILGNLYQGTYILQVRNIDNCQIADTFSLSFKNIPCVSFYNVLTPNNDNDNDYWIIDNINLFPDCEVRIYDQFKLVFESVGYTQSWDGKDKNGNLVNPGTYFYEVQLHKNGYKPYLGIIEVIY